MQITDTVEVQRPVNAAIPVVSTHRPVCLLTTVSCSQSGGASLQVTWLAATATAAAADGDGVDAAAVAIAGAVVTCPSAVPRRPHKDRAPPMPTL